MKGVLFSIVEDAITAEHGAEAWDALLTKADVDGGYTSLGDYPDDEFYRLIAVGAELLDVPPRDLTRHLGHSALLALGDRYPDFFSPHARAIDFVLTINDVIHPEVRKLHREADPPEFDFTVGEDGELTVAYHSRRRLCALAEGMIRGAATYYGDRVVVEHETCRDAGDDTCVLRCRFAPGDQALR